MSAKKIQSTKDYRLFTRHSGENRPMDIKKHRKLEESMKLYGFLESFPIVCYRDDKQRLVVKDGQHRLAIAEALGLPVHFVIETIDFDVAVVNSTAKIWVLRDYAQKHATNGKKAYQDGMEFADLHDLPLGTAFSLLAGTTSFGNCQESFIDGSFKVKDRTWAELVASIYGPIVAISPKLKNARFTEACMAVCRVDIFEPKRLTDNAERCREKLVAYSTRDGYLEMIESVYNFGKHKIVSLKNLAIMTMRERNATVKSAKAKAQKKMTQLNVAGFSAV